MVDTPVPCGYYPRMTHDSAVRTIVSLVPKIEKSGSAADVLSNYAREEDLPPAQLEKLAQVYNTLRTVSHIEKAADRGSSVELLDVPTLVVGYALGMDREKQALAPVRESSHDVNNVDLMAALRNDIAGPRVPKHIEKAASTPMRTITRAQLLDEVIDLEVDARLEMSKFAQQVFALSPRDSDGAIDISGAERDAVSVCGKAMTKQASDWLDQMATAGRFSLVHHDFDATLAKRAFANVAGPSGDAMVSLANSVHLRNVMIKLATDTPGPDDIGGGTATAAPAAATNPSQAESDLRAAVTADPSLLDDPDFVQILTDGGIDVEDLRPPAAATPGATDAMSAIRGQGGGGGTIPPADNPPKTDKEKDTDKGKGSDSKPSGGLGIGDLWGAAKAPISAAAGGIRDAAAQADSLLTDITSKERTNKAQQRTDLSVEDVRRAINIRRMIGTDPVLREADPRAVLEIYNSIARLNPDIAGNPGSMKLLLREAVSYEGLTLDSQKQLTDIRKGTSDAEAKEFDNNKRRYTAGGVAPISIGSR